jgi:uncharacterized membrane protein SirB2
MTDYLAIKAVHLTCVAVSYALFLVRGIWMIRDSAMLERRWVKVLPHVNDTLLLAAAIALALMLRQYPFADTWLTAKVMALVLYIGLGTVALKPGRDKRVRVAAWIAAQIVFLYIVAVAYTRDALILSW